MTLLQWMIAQRDEADKELLKFKEQFELDPCLALEWSSTIFKFANRKMLFQNMLETYTESLLTRVSYSKGDIKRRMTEELTGKRIQTGTTETMKLQSEWHNACLDLLNNIDNRL